jgi:3-hydroxyisobutyrate dehydrogenase-like beta-hydroxyacid dehydrogenase
MLIGANAGIDLGALAQIVPVSAGASRTFDNIPRSVLPGTFTAGGTLDILAKDLHLACELAREVGRPRTSACWRMTCSSARRRRAGDTGDFRTRRGSWK